MKQLPVFLKQTVYNVAEFNSVPISVPRNFEKIAKFTIGQIISSGQWKYAFYDLDNHPDKNTIASVDPTYYRGDFTTFNTAYFSQRTHIISTSDNHSVFSSIVDDHIPRHAYPLLDDSSIICVNQKDGISEQETLTLVDVICVKPGDSLIRNFDEQSYLIPLEGEIVISGHRRLHKQLTIISDAKDLTLEGIDDVLLAVFK